MNELLRYLLDQGQNFRRARLPSLYADFSLQRQSNPDGFTANSLAWREALAKAAQAGLIPAPGNAHDTLSLRTGEELLNALEIQDLGRPLALGSVIDEAVSQRQMIPYDEFFAARKSIYSRSWTVQPWQLLSWGLKQCVTSAVATGAGQIPAGRFVITQNLEEAAAHIMKQMANSSNWIDRIYTFSKFSTEAAKAMNLKGVLTDSDRDVVLTYLARDKQAVVFDRSTIKFIAPEETSSNLSEQDKIVASLKSLIAEINAQTEILSTQIRDLTEEARNAIKNKDGPSAAKYLRSKRFHETALVQRSETLRQLEEVFGQIEQAADQVAIVRLMQASTTVLRKLRPEIGSVDEIQDLVEGLKEKMDEVSDISNALEVGGEDWVNESAVNDELENMARQATAEDAEKEARKTRERLASTAIDGDSAVPRAPRDIKSSQLQPSSSRLLDEHQDHPVQKSSDALAQLSLNEASESASQHNTPISSPDQSPATVLAS